MDTTTAIAIYAGLVASAGLGWQVYTWSQAHRTRVRVDVANAFLTFPDRVPHVAMITVTNLSEHPIRVTSAGFDFQDGSGRVCVLAAAPPGATLPGIIEPHDSASTWLDESEFAAGGIDVYRPLRAWATLATRQTVKSKPRTLMTRDSPRARRAA